MIDASMLRTLSRLTSFSLLSGVGFSLYDFHEKGQYETHFDSERVAQLLGRVERPEPPISKALSYEDDIVPAILEFDWTGAPQVLITDYGPSKPPVESPVLAAR